MTRALVTGLLLAGAAPALQAQAQGGGETILSATVSQRFEAATNLDLDIDDPGLSYFTESRLALALGRATPSQALSLRFDTGLRAIWPAEDDFEFTLASPSTASAQYSTDWVNGGIFTEFRVRQSRVDFLETLDFGQVIVDDIPILVPDDLVRNERDTIERRYDGAIMFDFGRDSPSSYRVSLRGAAFTFSDDDESLVERQEGRAEGTWRLRLSPVLSTEVEAIFRLTDLDDDEETTIRETDIVAGVILQPSERLSLSFGAGIGQRVQRETESGSRETVEDNTGLTLRAGLEYEVEERLGIEADLLLSGAGDRTRGDLRAVYDLPRGNLSAFVTQDFAGSSRGDLVRVTRAGLGYGTQLDALTNLTLSADYGIQSDSGVDANEDIHRADFTAAVSRTLARDVFATLGYRFRYFNEEESATSNAVFVTVGRSFETPF